MRWGRVARQPALFVSLGLEDLAATVHPGWADVVTQMLLARVGLDRGGWINQKIMRTVHTAL